MNTKKITYVAMLTALYVVLSILTPIRVTNFKFTFEAFPILIAGFLYGPKIGLLVGTLGSFLYQILFSSYGLTLTTALWILPHSISGLFVGYASKKLDYKLNRKNIIIISSISALLVTSLNTLALFLDSKIYGYYSFALVFSTIPFKIIAGILLAILYSTVLPVIIKQLSK